MPSIPDLPVLLLDAGGALLLSNGGEVRTLTRTKARNLLSQEPHIICHLPSIIRHLNSRTSWKPHAQSADVLELFAFVFPARFCAPSPKGLAFALELPPPQSTMQSANFLYQAAGFMLEQLALAQISASHNERTSLIAIAHVMKETGWIWSEGVLEALGNPPQPEMMNQALQIWNVLPEWKETLPNSSKTEHPLAKGEASERLSELLGKMRKPRAGQFDYAESAATAFACRQDHGAAQVVMAEAGTGIGKTLGYLSAAEIWSQRNCGIVWISTYTKNLQHQLKQETRLLFTNEDEHNSKVVLRKGRSNYLCLLRLEEWLSRNILEPQRKIQASLIARWVAYTSDGAVIGGDFPNWLMSDIDSPVENLRDRNQECIHGACPHHRKCFAEHIVRRARKASLVVVNHALVMSRLARMDTANDDLSEEEKPKGGDFPPRFVFDEGQHLFDVADSVFSLHCTGATMASLRRWLTGFESRVSVSPRGLRARVQAVGVDDDAEVSRLLGEIIVAAKLLPDSGWRNRLHKGMSKGVSESFLKKVRDMILERNLKDGGFYSLDTPCRDLPEDLLATASDLSNGMEQLRKLLEQLCRHLNACTSENGDNEYAFRNVIELLIVSIRRSSLAILQQWCEMLAKPILVEKEETENQKYIDLFSLERKEGHEADVGMHRHWIDPTEPFARQVLEPSQGALITSATLHDGGAENSRAGQEVEDKDDDVRIDWKIAEIRTGATHLTLPARRFSIESPFDYRKQARIFLVNDINPQDNKATSAAYGDLFLATGGGGLGLFTSIARLRQTYRDIAPRLQECGIELFAQHVDAMDTATLTNAFRIIESSCLLGCDAVRDGIDIPGPSLRLVVLDKLPWPRRDVLHKARLHNFGGSAYDLMLTRFRLRQAFGRLIRAESDRGVFIFLNRSIPGHLRDAFPKHIPWESLSLKTVAEKSAAFLQ